MPTRTTFSRPDEALALKALVLSMDAALDRHRIARMGTPAVRQTLALVNRFQSAAETVDARFADRNVLSAGYRLSADLGEMLMLRLVELRQDRQHSLDFLNAELRRRIRERHEVDGLLQQAHSSRNRLCDAGNSHGLGVLL